MVVGVLMALWCLAFATVNVVFEVSGRFTEGAYADYASGISVMNWLVVGLKLLGATVAILSVARRPRIVSPTVVTVAVWAVFATLGVYTFGSVAQAIGMISGLAGSVDQIDLAHAGYLLFFLAGASGYGALALSYSRRHGRRKAPALLGAVLAPAVLASVLLGIPTLLAALGLLPPH
jgi:hypothetical protein